MHKSAFTLTLHLHCLHYINWFHYVNSHKPADAMHLMHLCIKVKIVNDPSVWCTILPC